MAGRFTPIQNETLQERVYSELRNAIIRGEFTPGETITIRDIAKEMGTSTMPVREALQKLVTERALEAKGSRSLKVPELTQEKFKDLVDTRLIIEPEAAARATPNVTEQDIKRLREMDERLEAYARDNKADLVLKYNRSFHFAIYELANIPTLYQIIDSLWLQGGPYSQAILDKYRTINNATQSPAHAEILAAFEEGNAAKAKKAMYRDISEASEWYSNTYFTEK